MKILVTGGAGYIGSILVPRLLEKGHEVTVLDNFMYNQTSLMDCCHYKKLTIVRGDVRDRKLVSTCLKKVDALFPLAAIVGAPACDKDPTAARTINLGAIKMLLKLRRKDQMIIFPCTNSGYGIGSDNIFCTEETPLRPISLYGRTKVAAEKEVLNAGNAITLRLATAFGISPRMNFDYMINDFVYRALSDRSIILFEAHFKRNFIYVGDVARAFIHCLENFDKMKNEPYNVGLSDANLSKWELCEKIKKQFSEFCFSEYKGEPWAKDPDKRNYIVSNAKIEATGFKAKTSLQEGIAELIKGYRVIRKGQFQFSNV